MKITFFGAALAVATLVQAGAVDYLAGGPHQLARGFEADADGANIVARQLEPRASNSKARAVAAAAAKAKAAAAKQAVAKAKSSAAAA